MIPNEIPKGRIPLKIAGSIAVFLAIIAIGLDSSVYSWFINFKLFGAWWGFIGVVLLGLFAFFINTKPTMVLALGVSIPVVIVALIGSIIDAAGSSYFKKFACINNAGQLSGYSNLFSNATYCFDKKITFNNYTTDPNPTTYNCYCADYTNRCLYLNTKYHSQCNLIFSTYSPTLTAGSVFDFLAFITILTFSIMTCCSVCCPQNFHENDSNQPYGTYPSTNPYGGPTFTTASTGFQPVVYGTAVNATAAPVGGQTELYGKPVQAYATSTTGSSGGVVYGNVVSIPPSGVKY